jgi:excisionase family DNA binding protein
MVATDIRTIQAEEEEQGIFEQISSFLEERGPAILMNGDHRIEIPESLFDVICQAVEILRGGGAVSIVPYNTALTTQQAADYLGVSRPYLISILEKENIEYTYVGTHRRISLNEIEKYRVRRDAERLATLNTMTREAYELGLYDVNRPDEGTVRGSS